MTLMTLEIVIQRRLLQNMGPIERTLSIIIRMVIVQTSLRLVNLIDVFSIKET